MYSFFAEELNFANIGLQKEDITFYNVTDSTNTRAREAFLESPGHTPRLFAAGEQTAGRGTRGRSFESLAGGLYFSLLFSPEKAGYDFSRVTQLAAAAAYAAVYSMLGRRLGCGLLIKWVNDLFLDGKKIAGILCERVKAGERDGCIIGIGINLCRVSFSPDLRNTASSIEELRGVKIEKDLLLFEILRRLLPALSSQKDGRLIRIYKRRGLKKGTKITVTDSLGNKRAATVLGLNSELALCVRYDGGECEELISGDVSIKL